MTPRVRSGFSEISELTAWRLVASPTRARRFARVLVLGFVLFVLVLIFVPWQQTARGRGRMIAFSPVERQQKIAAPISGRVVKWHVREGSRVHKGQIVVELADIDPALLIRLRRQRDEMRARIAALEAGAKATDARQRRLRSARYNALSAAASRAQAATDKVRGAEQAVAAAKVAAATARLNLERQRELFRDGLSSKRTLELAELKAATTRAKVDRSVASLAAARSQARARRADRGTTAFARNASIESARASYASVLASIASAKASLARLETQVARQQAQRVAAPRDGSIFRILAKEGGEVVKAGAPLALIVPDTRRRAVELWMDGNDLPLLKVGRKVRLQFEGWPALQFSGWPSISFGTFGGRVAVIDATDDGKGHFRILVLPDPLDTPWPDPIYLRQGVLAQGWVLLETVTLGYELWRRFNGFPPLLPRSATHAIPKKEDATRDEEKR